MKRNPYSAFGFAPDEATVSALRSDLAYALRQFIEQGQMSQKKAAHSLGLSQNIISHIVRGQTEHLSVERLIKAMVRAQIPGYAEWSGSPDDAKAGRGYHEQGIATIAGTITFTDAYAFDRLPSSPLVTSTGSSQIPVIGAGQFPAAVEETH